MDEYEVRQIVQQELNDLRRELRQELTYETQRIGWRCDDVEDDLRRHVASDVHHG